MLKQKWAKIGVGSALVSPVESWHGALLTVERGLMVLNDEGSRRLQKCLICSD